jgi:hypothetical protein
MMLVQGSARLLSSGPGPYLHLMKRLEYWQIKRQELLLNVAGPKRSFCARNLRPKMGLKLVLLLPPLAICTLSQWSSNSQTWSSDYFYWQQRGYVGLKGVGTPPGVHSQKHSAKNTFFHGDPHPWRPSYTHSSQWAVKPHGQLSALLLLSHCIFLP